MNELSAETKVETTKLAWCDRLHAAWRTWQPATGTTPPHWDHYLPALGESCDPERVLYLVQLDIEHRVKAGLPALLAERYFQHPRLSQADAQLNEAQQVELIRWEYQLRWKNGDRAQSSDYRSAFPQHAGILGDLRPRWTCPRCRRPAALEDETVEALCCPGCATSFSLTEIFQPRAAPATPAEEGPEGLDLREYELFDRLGSGGMGEVYRGRDPSLGRDLAVKVVRDRYRGHPEVEQRFLQEARLTGSLQHPDIVPIHNLGRLPDGRLYYTMKLVRGQTLDRLLAGRPAGQPESLPGLLSIFEKVCQAIAYAHSKGVIHRDLKPANVMVGAFGEVQVMDWGLAKVVGCQESQPVEEERLPPSVGEDGRTIPGQAMGTPAYMSPEQANGRWSQVGPASDIFSLGATLYHLLTGRQPYSGPQALESAQLGRSPRPRQLDRRLSPALEAVCLKAMAPAPEDRYATALELAQDLQRWLADQPVSCYRDRLPTRLARWARQHRTLAAGGVAGLAAAAVFLAVLLVVIERARQGTEKARLAEASARQQTREALNTLTDEVVRRLLTRQRGPDDQEKDFLRRVLGHYEAFAEEDHSDPKARLSLAEGLHRVGVIRNLLGDASGAEEPLLRARDLLTQVTSHSQDVPGLLHGLAETHRQLADVLKKLDRRPAAEAEYRQALLVLDRLSAGTPHSRAFRLDRVRILNELSLLLESMDRLDGAETTLDEALELLTRLAEELPGDANVRDHQAENRMSRARLFDRAGKRSKAESEYREALRLLKEQAATRAHDPGFLQNLALSQFYLGSVLQSQGRPREAELAYRDGWSVLSDLVHDYPNVPDYRKSQAALRTQWGVTLQELGRIEDAEKVYRRASEDWQFLASRFPNLPEYSEAQARTHNDLGRLLRILRRPRDAEAEYRKALKLSEGLAEQRRDVPQSLHSHAITWLNLANALLEQKRYKDVLAAYQEAIALSTRLVRDHPRDPEYRQTLITAQTNQAVLLARMQRSQEAAAAFDSACAEQQKLVDQSPETPEYAYRHWNLLFNRAVFLREAQQLGKAEVSVREALAVQRKLAQRHQAQPAYQDAVALSLHLLASLLRGQQKDDEALRLLEEAMAFHQRALQLSPKTPAFRGSFHATRLTTAGIHLDRNNHAAAAGIAKELSQLGANPAEDSFDAASVLAWCAQRVEKDDRVPQARRLELGRDYADQALVFLKEAVQRGFGDPARLRSNPGFASLRQRPDFQELLRQLESRKARP